MTDSWGKPRDTTLQSSDVLASSLAIVYCSLKPSQLFPLLKSCDPRKADVTQIFRSIGKVIPQNPTKDWFDFKNVFLAASKETLTESFSKGNDTCFPITLVTLVINNKQEARRVASEHGVGFRLRQNGAGVQDLLHLGQLSIMLHPSAKVSSVAKWA